MQKSQKLTASILLVACIAYSLFFPDSVNTALVFVLYTCMLMYLFSKRELPVLSRMKIMIAAFMFSMLMTAVCIAAAELLRGYFLFDGVLMGCLMFLELSSRPFFDFAGISAGCGTGRAAGAGGPLSD